MSNPWFRFYSEVVDDPKVQTLEPTIFKIWVNMLCLSCKGDGTLPPIESMAFSLRATLEETKRAVSALVKANLIDERKNQHGQTLTPHNWAKRQFKSDSSTERVERFRNVARNGDVMPSESDTEQIRKQKKRSAILDKPKRPAPKSFSEWWKLNSSQSSENVVFPH